MLLASVAVAAAASFALVPAVGDRYLERIRRFDPTRLAVAVLCLLVVLSGLFAGGIGVGTFAAATAVGLVPARFGAKRSNLMGVLVVPLAL